MLRRSFASLVLALALTLPGGAAPETGLRTTHQDQVESVASFGPRVFTASRDGTVKMWVGGQVEHTFEPQAANGRLHEPFTAVAVSPDGQQVAAIGASGVYRWEVESGRELPFMPQEYPDAGFGLSWSSGRLVVGYDNAVIRRGADSLKTEEVLVKPPPGQEFIHFMDCHDAAHFAVLQRDVNHSSGKMVLRRFDWSGHPAGDTVIDWVSHNAEVDLTGKRVAITDSRGGIALFSFDAAGKLHRDGEVNVPGQELGQIAWTGPYLGVGEFADGKGYHAALLTPQGKVLAEAACQTYPRSMLVCSVAGHPSLVVGQNNGLVQWIGAADTPVKGAVNPELSWVGLTNDGRSLVAETNQGTFQLWDLTRGKPVERLHPFGREDTVLRDADDMAVASGGTAAAVLSSGELLMSNAAEGKSVSYDFAHHHLVGEAPRDQRLIGLDRRGDPIYVDHFATYLEGHMLFNPPGHQTWVCSAAACGSGYLLARRDGSLAYAVGSTVTPVGRNRDERPLEIPPHRPPLLRSDSTGANVFFYRNREIARLTERGGHAPAYVQARSLLNNISSMVVCPDGVAVGQTDGTIALLDAELHDLKELHGHTGAVNSLAVAKNRLISASQDGTVKFWDLPTGRALVTLHPLNEAREWVATTPDGHFDGSSQGTRLLEITVNGLRYHIEQFFEDYYTPGLVQRVLFPSASTALQKVPPLEGNSRPPEVKIEPGTGEVWVQTLDEGGGISKVGLYVNGHRLPAPSEQQGNRYRFLLTLAPGANHLRATAFNAAGTVESAGATTSVEGPPSADSAPVLHVLACGVNRYSRAHVSALAFARQDAASVAGFFKPGLYGKVEVVSLFDEQASKQAIVAELTRLQATRPQDAVVLFFAGHGVMTGQHFAYLPADGQTDSPEVTASSCLRSDELTGMLSHIPANCQLVVLDCCQSGGASSDFERIRAQQKLARSSGAFMLAAAAADQAANEFPSLQHGVLTYSMLEGLGQGHPPAARLDAEKRVTVGTLMAYVSQAVPRLTDELHAEGQDVVLFTTPEDFPLTRP